MKYWRKRIVYMMAIMLSAGGIAGNMGSEIVLTEEKETVKGRYAEQKLSLPEENCKAVIDICFLEDGTMRIAYRDSEAKLKTADSKDQGKSWETPRDLWEEFGKSRADDGESFQRRRNFQQLELSGRREYFSGSLPFGGRKQKRV